MPVNEAEDTPSPSRQGSTGSWRDRAVPVDEEAEAKKAADLKHQREEDEKGILQRTGEGFVDDIKGKAKATGGLFTGTPIGEQIPVVGPLIRKATNYGSAALESTWSDKSIGDLYDDNERRSSEAEQGEMKSNPGALALKGTLGSFALPAGSVSESLLAKSSPRIARIAAPVENVVQNAGISYADSRLRGDSNDDAIDRAKMAAALAAKFSGGIEAAKLAGRGYSRFVAQIKPDTLSHYRENRAEINTMNPHDKYEEFAGAADQMRDRGETIKNNALSSIERDKQRAMAEANSRQQQAIARADQERQEGLTKADGIKDRVENERRQNETRAQEIQRGTAEDLSRAQTAARRAINESAYEAMELAEKSGAQIPLKGFKASLTRRLNEYNVGEIRPNPSVPMLEKLREELDGIGKPSISAKEMRTLIKSLDDKVELAFEPGRSAGHTTPIQRDLLGVRHDWSERMKDDVPGYRDAQDKTSGKTRAMEGMQKRFSFEPDKIYNELNGLDEPNRIDRANSLRTFQEEFGGDYMTPLEQAKALRERDFSPDLKEASELRNKDYKSPYKMDFDIAEAMRRKDFAEPYQGDLQRAKETSKLGRRVTDEDTARAFMEQFGRDPEKWIGKRKQMEAIAREQGLPEDYYVKTARNLAVKRGMEGGQIQGSRAVNAGAHAGETIGGKYGRMAGSWLGLASDVIGKSVVKKVIDIVDTPAGQAFAKGMRAAAARGPQALTVWHGLKMRNDPEYKKLMEQGE